MTFNYHASVAAGLEPAAATELRSLGLDVFEEGRGLVRFRGTAEDGVRATLAVRSAPRVTLELADDYPAEAAGLLEGLTALPWEDHLPGDATWAARVVGTSEALRDTRYTARLVKDAVRDRCRARGIAAPEVDPGTPQVLVEVRVDRGRARIGLDLAGGSLHERGTGRHGEAPLREDVAAGLALLVGVDPARPLLDPFCGTGTVIAEAASIALGIPPVRDPMTMSFARLPHFDDVRPQRIVRELREASRAGQPHAPFLAYDNDPRMVKEARRALGIQGLSQHVHVDTGAVPGVPLPADLEPGLLLSNPPWGLRLEAAEDAWFGIGRFARERLSGWRLALLSGNADVTRKLGMKADRRYPVRVGGVDCRLLVYSVR